MPHHAALSAGFTVRPLRTPARISESAQLTPASSPDHVLIAAIVFIVLVLLLHTFQKVIGNVF